MSAEKTKQHFAEICECLWDKAQYQEKLDKEVVSAMRKFIANFTMIAWNACIMQKTYSDVKKFLGCVVNRFVLYYANVKKGCRENGECIRTT